jgi:hypothetical protein
MVNDTPQRYMRPTGENIENSFVTRFSSIPGEGD